MCAAAVRACSGVPCRELADLARRPSRGRGFFGRLYYQHPAVARQCRRLLLDFVMPHAIHVWRIARALKILGATAVAAIGLLQFSVEIV
jgi:hypothetical protein